MVTAATAIPAVQTILVTVVIRQAVAAVPVALVATTVPTMSMALQAASACNQISQEQLLVMAVAAAFRVGMGLQIISPFLLTAVQMENQLLAPTVAVVELLLFPVAQA